MRDVIPQVGIHARKLGLGKILSQLRAYAAEAAIWDKEVAAFRTCQGIVAQVGADLVCRSRHLVGVELLQALVGHHCCQSVFQTPGRDFNLRLYCRARQQSSGSGSMVNTSLCISRRWDTLLEAFLMYPWVSWEVYEGSGWPKSDSCTARQQDGDHC